MITEILVKKDRMGLVIDDWMECGECDLTLRMSKTTGCRVIETTDALYAERIVSYLRAAEKVNVKQSIKSKK
ncbi:hypothetical protein C7Y71_000050 [Pseudoprevotella muciniphila]|uniref:Uncharacterized protein n=1 Tax=Pseudoprevotella muciniphila TaxID=2133944 RepID=A0A5P8E3M9_9BACT|nr:hypothetical protein [Pseudoprevotella muciniphila]QFQ11552.1 hypothetical protein C7Y71_000050 [Pseudoprevotella muciniphila]